MAKRNATYRVSSEQVQGEGSYVVLRRLPYAEARNAALRADEANAAEEAQYTQRMITAGVVEWDWVDDNGDPLPLPREVDFDELGLLIHEVEFLVTHLVQAPDIKN